MIIRITLTFLSCFTLTFSTFAKGTSFSGIIPEAEKQEVRLLTYADHISGRKIILATDTINSDGYFKLDFNISATTYGILEINYYNYELILIPGENYYLECDSIITQNIQRPFYNKEKLSGILTDSTGLNANISKFNLEYNDWLIKNFDQIYKKRRRNLIYEFRDSTKTRFADVSQKYFKDYVNYKIASVELAAMSTAKPELFRKFLDGRPILYNNTEYMYFFNQFFDHYISSNSRAIKRNDLIYSINYIKSVPTLMDSLGKDTLLRNEKLRELVMLKGLRELYYTPDYSKTNIITMLAQIKLNSGFTEHKKIATNLLNTLTKLEKGSPAPDFTLPDLQNEIQNLSHFTGKPLYISFVTSWSYGCLFELEMLKTLNEKYQDRINFVSVAMDDNIAIVQSLTDEKGYSWPFLYSGFQYQLINDYDVKTFPLFVMIDKDGNILQYPAPKPSESAEAYFDSLLNRH